jgi:hypothetical protein
MRTPALIVTSLAAVLALPSAAGAQVYAGGSIGAGRSPAAVGSSELGFRVSGSRITVRGVLTIPCRGPRSAEVEGGGVGTLSPDGTFRVRFGKARLQPTSSTGFRRSAVVTGRLVRAYEIRGRIDATASGDGARGCRGGADYVARWRPDPVDVPAPAPAGARLIGMNSSRLGPFGVNLRVAPDGSRITQFIVGARYRCARLPTYQETNYSPPITINPDGTFRRVERFRVPFADVIDSVTVTTEGHFVNGGAIGTWHARATSRSRRTGRVVDRCGTGALTWAAAVV